MFMGSSAFAVTHAIRWTGTDDANADFAHVIDAINQKTGLKLSFSDFLLYESRQLATSNFRTYLQAAGGVPLKGMNVRVWTDLSTGAAIQVEAHVEDQNKLRQLAIQMSRFNLQLKGNEALSNRLRRIAKAAVSANPEDNVFRDVSYRDEWIGADLARVFRVTGRRGHHVISVSIPKLKVLKSEYRPFPREDGHGAVDTTFSVPAMVFPIWEETVGGVQQSRILTQLRNLKSQVQRTSEDPYASLRYRSYPESMQDTVLGQTAEGQAKGYWSTIDVKEKAAGIRAKIPLTPNGFANGVILEGKYATVGIHPDVLSKLGALPFQPGISSIFKPTWKTMANGGGYEMIPLAALLGRPLTSYESAFQRTARRLPDHNPVSYIGDGFDEIQVYWAIDTLMETFQSMGYTDPELSTRPFNAFLYDPDIEMRDNAFYHDDTINFTTYSAGNQNYARDNSTIWHEIGHGIMDRVMGDLIKLNDTGGLSEGMADFLAALVISKVTNLQKFPGDQDFRIINSTAFNLTNESHDDGEAYGGAMYDLLMAATTKYGIDGVTKISDLTFEAMRLTRNHPSLTAQDWFSHMLFADERGHAPVRAAGELRELIIKALNGRNFSFDGTGLAEFKIFNGTDEVVTDGLGTRYKPITIEIAKDEKSSFNLKVLTTSGANGVLRYPLKVIVGLRGGPLQGSVKWDGEENGPTTFVLNSESEAAQFTLTANGTCDERNREDGCSDFAYIQLQPPGAPKPVAKKRFYVRIKTTEPAPVVKRPARF